MCAGCPILRRGGTPNQNCEVDNEIINWIDLAIHGYDPLTFC